MESDDMVEEECMALEAIFMDSFSKLDDRRIRVVVEPPPEEVEDPEGWALYLEMTLPEGYPTTVPVFDLSNINNVAFNHETQDAILAGLKEQSESEIGEQMVYNLVEWVRENLPAFIQQSRQEKAAASSSRPVDDTVEQNQSHQQKDKKEKMTKAQKRRYYDRFGVAEEKPRGWNWVDILSHLSKKPPQAPGGSS